MNKGKGYDWHMTRDSTKPGLVEIQFVQSLSDEDWSLLAEYISDFDRIRRTLEGA